MFYALFNPIDNRNESIALLKYPLHLTTFIPVRSLKNPPKEFLKWDLYCSSF